MTGPILIVDLEGTCCDDDSIPQQDLETIEIGAVIVGPECSEFQSFVRPVVNPKLTDFCCKLTSIQQRDVDAANVFPHVWPTFRAWCGDLDTFYSWGTYDRDQFKRDCLRHGLKMDLNHVNLARVCKKHFKTLSKWRVTKQLGIEFDGTVHRGIDDARHYGKIVSKMMEMGIVIGA